MINKNKFSLYAFMLAAVVALFATSTSNAQAATVYDMKGAVERALEANPGMLSARHDLLGAEYGKKSALGSFGPSATVTYGYTRKDHLKPDRDVATSDQDVFTATLNIHQDLFTGFNLLSTYQKSVLSEENAAATVNNVELSLISTVQENFLGLLKAREDVRSAKDSVTRLTEQLKVTKAFYDVGLKPRLDLLQAEVDLAQAEDTLLKAENSVATQNVRLNTLLDLSIDADVEYQGDLQYQPFTMGIDEALISAYETRPDLVIAAKAIAIAVEDKDIVDSAFYPQAGADFNWSSVGDKMTASGSERLRTEYSEWSAGVSVSWKFFEWGKTYHASKQADENVKSLMKKAEETRQNAIYDVKSNHLDINQAAESIRVNKKAVEAAEEGYRMAVARYQNQVGTNTDVLDAQERLTQAEAGLTTALADYKIALSQLYVSIGQKNPSLLSK